MHNMLVTNNKSEIITEILHNVIATCMQYFCKYNLLNCNIVTVNFNIFYKIFFNIVVIYLIKYKNFNIIAILLQYFVL